MKTDQKSTSKASRVHATLKRAVFRFFSKISSKSGKFEIFLFGNPICLGFATIAEKISSNGQILAKIAHSVVFHLKQAIFKGIGAWKQLNY